MAIGVAGHERKQVGTTIDISEFRNGLSISRFWNVLQRVYRV
jgi:hypothetical protein